MRTAMPISTRPAWFIRNRDEVDVPLVVIASVSQRVARNARPMTGSAIQSPSDVIASVSEAIQLRLRKDSGLLRRFTPRNDGLVAS